MSMTFTQGTDRNGVSFTAFTCKNIEQDWLEAMGHQWESENSLFRQSIEEDERTRAQWRRIDRANGRREFQRGVEQLGFRVNKVSNCTTRRRLR